MRMYTGHVDITPKAVDNFKNICKIYRIEGNLENVANCKQIEFCKINFGEFEASPSSYFSGYKQLAGKTLAN